MKRILIYFNPIWRMLKMKKLLVLLVVLGLVSVSNAAVIDVLITSVDGEALTTPTKEITLTNPSSVIDFQITFF
jgi:hypothetical protein